MTNSAIDSNLNFGINVMFYFKFKQVFCNFTCLKEEECKYLLQKPPCNCHYFPSCSFDGYCKYRNFSRILNKSIGVLGKSKKALSSLLFLIFSLVSELIVFVGNRTKASEFIKNDKSSYFYTYHMSSMEISQKSLNNENLYGKLTTVRYNQFSLSVQWIFCKIWRFTMSALLVFLLTKFLESFHVNAGSPTNNYAPGLVSCPDNPSLVRVGNGLSGYEKAYVDERRKKHISGNLVRFFNQVAIPGFNAQQFFHSDRGSETILGLGLGVSGGGFRAMLTGAGALKAMDIRTPDSSEKGQIGGLLQSMSYISGLSGGAWLIGSVFMQNMPTIQHITSPDGPWELEFNPITGDRKGEKSFNINLEYDILRTFTVDDKTGSSALAQEMRDNNILDRFRIDNAIELATKPFNNVKQPLENVKQYYSSLYEEIAPKKAAGFALSITDFWARSLSRAFLAKNIDISTSWSDIVNLPKFKSREMPYPILISNAVVPKVLADANSSTIIEMSPYEFGSWSPTINAFAPIKYLGTKLFGGKVVPDEKGELSCIEGFDNLSFIIASSSSLFNDLAAMGMKHLDGFPQIRSVITKYKQLLNILNTDNSNIKNNMDYALYSPNPFHGFHEGISLPAPADLKKGLHSDLITKIKEHGNAYTISDTLHIVDGGEDDLNVPLDPLLRPERKMDMVIALDVSLDKGSKPNGTSIFRGTWRYHGKEDTHRISFPIIPKPEVFIESGANLRPVFFGCDLKRDYLKPELHGSDLPLSKYLEGQHEKLLPKPPLIVYIPNHAVSYDSQQPTTRLIYNENDVHRMVQNGYDMFTQKNSSRWASCLGCSMIHREFVKRGEELPEFCQGCFMEYCYKV